MASRDMEMIGRLRNERVRRELMDKLQEDKRQTLEYKKFDDAVDLAEFVNKRGLQRSDIQKLSYSPKEDAYCLLWWEMRK